jgi:hypothetical protein
MLTVQGKVESDVGHAQKTPLKGMRFESLEEAQAYLDDGEQRWADSRIHGTTKRQVAAMLAEERPALLAVAARAFSLLPAAPCRNYRPSHRPSVPNHVSQSRTDRGAPHSGRASLAKKYGVASADDACAIALETGACEYRFVRRYLEHNPQLPLSLHPLIRQLTIYRDLIQNRTRQENDSCTL